jgi:hypothetical protein
MALEGSETVSREIQWDWLFCARLFSSRGKLDHLLKIIPWNSESEADFKRGYWEALFGVSGNIKDFKETAEKLNSFSSFSMKETFERWVLAANLVREELKDREKEAAIENREEFIASQSKKTIQDQQELAGLLKKARGYLPKLKKGLLKYCDQIASDLEEIKSKLNNNPRQRPVAEPWVKGVEDSDDIAWLVQFVSENPDFSFPEVTELLRGVQSGDDRNADFKELRRLFASHVVRCERKKNNIDATYQIFEKLYPTESSDKKNQACYRKLEAFFYTSMNYKPPTSNDNDNLSEHPRLVPLKYRWKALQPQNVDEFEKFEKFLKRLESEKKIPQSTFDLEKLVNFEQKQILDPSKFEWELNDFPQSPSPGDYPFQFHSLSFHLKNIKKNEAEIQSVMPKLHFYCSPELQKLYGKRAVFKELADQLDCGPLKEILLIGKPVKLKESRDLVGPLKELLAWSGKTEHLRQLVQQKSGKEFWNFAAQIDQSLSQNLGDWGQTGQLPLGGFERKDNSWEFLIKHLQVGAASSAMAEFLSEIDDLNPENLTDKNKDDFAEKLVDQHTVEYRQTDQNSNSVFLNGLEELAELAGWKIFPSGGKSIDAEKQDKPGEYWWETEKDSKEKNKGLKRSGLIKSSSSEVILKAVWVDYDPVERKKIASLLAELKNENVEQAEDLCRLFENATDQTTYYTFCRSLFKNLNGNKIKKIEEEDPDKSKKIKKIYELLADLLKKKQLGIMRFRPCEELEELNNLDRDKDRFENVAEKYFTRGKYTIVSPSVEWKRSPGIQGGQPDAPNNNAPEDIRAKFFYRGADVPGN